MSDKSYKLGKTIVGARGKKRAVELERIKKRKRVRRRNVIIGVVLGVLLVMVATWLVMSVLGAVKERQAVEEVGGETWVPTVEIVSEGGGQASLRVQEFVARVERDFRDIGYDVERAVLPLSTMREVDVFVGGRVEYYKMTVDRGSAVQVEDAERMMRYLDEREIVAGYVDLRVEGRAYYK